MSNATIINSGVVLSIPRLIRIEGTATDRAARPKIGSVDVELELLSEKTSTTPIWREHQRAQSDKNGKFSVLMGATVEDGLPLTLFSGGGERWLLVVVDGVRQAPTLLTSTPYAMRSMDAEMLGGHPATDYLLAKDCCSFSAEDASMLHGSERPVAGWSSNPDAASFGVYGSVAGRNSIAGIFRTSGGGDLLLGTNETGNIFRVDASGKGYFNNGVQLGGADFAEMIRVDPAAGRFEPGDVLVIDRNSPGRFTLTSVADSTLVAGVYATRPGVVARDANKPAAPNEIPLAMIGIVPCKVSTVNGPIKVGDELVTAPEKGYAMRAGPNAPRGAVLGRALEELPAGQKKISILLSSH